VGAGADKSKFLGFRVFEVLKHQEKSEIRGFSGFLISPQVFLSENCKFKLFFQVGLTKSALLSRYV